MKLALRKIHRFRRLPPTERQTLVCAAMLLPCWWVRLKLFGHGNLAQRPMTQQWRQNIFNDNQSSVSGALMSNRRNIVSLNELRRIGELVNSAAHYVLPPGHCLARAMYLHWLLKRRGVYTDLKLGVRLDDGQLLAHAWVEWTGHPLNERSEIVESYAPFHHAVTTTDQAQR